MPTASPNHPVPDEDKTREAVEGPLDGLPNNDVHQPSQSCPASVIDNAGEDADFMNKVATINYEDMSNISRCPSCSSMVLDCTSSSSVLNEMDGRSPEDRVSGPPVLQHRHPVIFGLQKGQNQATDYWRDCTNFYARNYPKFNEEIYQWVRRDVGLDRPYLMTSNRNKGHYYFASERDIREKTRQRFKDEQKKIIEPVQVVATMSNSNEDQLAIGGTIPSVQVAVSQSSEVATVSPSLVETVQEFQQFVSAFRAQVEPRLDELVALPNEDGPSLLANLHWMNAFFLRLLSSGNVNGGYDATPDFLEPNP